MEQRDKAALAYALSLLARREHSAYEMRQKMQEKTFDDDTIDAVLDHCQQKKWQSDERFCESYIRYRSQKGYGLLKIKQELELRGVDSAVISEQLHQSAVDWTALATHVFEKKYAPLPRKMTTAQQQKMWRFMLSRGFQAPHFSHLLKG